MARAREAGLPGTWRALLSTGAVNARDRIGYEWDILVNMAGQTIATSKADLWDSTIAAPIDRTEFNLPRHAAAVWTATNSSGKILMDDIACRDWICVDEMSSATVGWSSSRSDAWVFGRKHNCRAQRHLYCVEQ